jgi:DNA repair exonuclease SbcCD nuclease subunit
VRQALVQAIAQTNPAFVVLTGDIVYNGYDKDDWKVWDSETAIWREKKIPVYPTLGNHDLHGSEKIALANYFERFPDLKNSVLLFGPRRQHLVHRARQRAGRDFRPARPMAQAGVGQPSQRRGLRVPGAASSPLHKLIG